MYGQKYVFCYALITSPNASHLLIYNEQMINGAEYLTDIYHRGPMENWRMGS